MAAPAASLLEVLKMNVHYDAPKDELVLDLADSGVSNLLHTEMDASGRVIAIRIAGASKLLSSHRPLAPIDHDATLARMVSEHEERYGEFDKTLSVEELARRQGVKPFIVEDVAGKWPGDRDDGFEELIIESRRVYSGD